MYGNQLREIGVLCHDSLEDEVYLITALLYGEALLGIVDGDLRGVALLETDGEVFCLELLLTDDLSIGTDLLEDTLDMTYPASSRE